MLTRLLPLLLALAASTTGVGAVTTDREQPVQVDADSANLDDQRRIATYWGNVVIQQGSLRITGDMVTMYFTESYDLSKLDAEGKPARFQQQLDDGTSQEGHAERIEYSLADSANLDDQRRIATYRGNAVIQQGSLRITGDMVILYFTESYDLSKLDAEGKPARFQQQLDDGTPQEGEGERIEYRVEGGAMLFAGKARITQGPFKMEAERIDYDSITGRIVGTGAETGKRRVTITVQAERE